MTKKITVAYDDDGIIFSLGQTIFFQRKLRGLTQEALAHAAGIDRSHMGKIERGERNLTVLNLWRIAKALGLQPWELMKAAHDKGVVGDGRYDLYAKSK